MLFKMSDCDFPEVWKHDISIMMYYERSSKFSYTFKLLMKPHLFTQIRGNKAVFRKQGSSLLIQHYKVDLHAECLAT